jgi:glycerol-3-phosphate O-acyltransferase/dihydroxyacetone phosphate acyltransferase
VGYRLVRRLARLLVGLFYRRVEVVGAERVPAAGGLVLAANHQNALVDPMLLVAVVPRRLRPVAKAPLFRYPVLGWLLRLAGAIPVQRRQDPGSDPAQNVAMFEAASETLAASGAILIFPEGVSQAEPRLMPLRTGAARLALAPAIAGAGAAGWPALLPVGLVYHEPGTFRTGWALVLVGEPVPLAEFATRATTAPETATRELTDRLAAALRGQIVEAHDRKLLRLARVVDTLWQAERGGPDGAAARTARMQAAMRAYRYLAIHEPARLAALTQDVERYAKDLDAAGLADGRLATSYPAGVVARYALREGAAPLLALPLALWGVVAHLVPYQATRLAVRLLRPEPDVVATYKILAGLALYPPGWALEAWLAWRLGGGPGLALFLGLLLPTGFFALSWWERVGRVRREAWGFVQFLVRRDLHRHLLARRRALVAELDGLVQAVPASVLAGSGTEPAS